MSVLLSIIIPTKNRYETLIPVISSFLDNIISDDYEIIIQDNSDTNDEMLPFLEYKKGDRLKYFYTNASLSIIENTEKAIENSIGKYAIFIGDDDLISPHIVDIVRILDERNEECLIYSPGRYWWDSVNFVSPNRYHNKKLFLLPLNINTNLDTLFSEEQLELFLNKGGTNYGMLPRFYHGIVKRSILDKIKVQTGSYLPGSSPDMSFSVSLALLVKSYCYINYPVSVFGASKNSGGGWTMSKTHYGDIKTKKHLPKNILDNWDINLPEIWSEHIIYIQTTWEVFSKFKIHKHINYLNAYASILVHEPYIFSYIYPKIKQYCKFDVKKYLIILTYCFLKISNKYLNKIGTALGIIVPYNVHSNCDIEECMNILKNIHVKKF